MTKTSTTDASCETRRPIVNFDGDEHGTEAGDEDGEAGGRAVEFIGHADEYSAGGGSRPHVAPKEICGGASGRSVRRFHAAVDEK